MTQSLPTIVTDLFASTIEEMKSRRVPGSHKEYSYGAHAGLEDHLEMLRQEFVGASELAFYHAVLTVLLRRRLVQDVALSRMQDLWQRERDFLCTELDSRWLVSACDTIVDHWTDRGERALALGASMFTNTLKLYETERWATGVAAEDPEYRPVDGRVPLHDGLSAFWIGHGDMVFQLMRRANLLAQEDSVAGRILLELHNRAKQHDTVFRRFLRVHQRDEVRW